jgi:hypothetical protein
VAWYFVSPNDASGSWPRLSEAQEWSRGEETRRLMGETSRRRRLSSLRHRPVEPTGDRRHLPTCRAAVSAGRGAHLSGCGMPWWSCCGTRASPGITRPLLRQTSLLELAQLLPMVPRLVQAVFPVSSKDHHCGIACLSHLAGRRACCSCAHGGIGLRVWRAGRTAVVCTVVDSRGR